MINNKKKVISSSAGILTSTLFTLTVVFNFFHTSSASDSDFTPQWTWPTNLLLWPDLSHLPLSTSPRPRMKVSLARSHDREVLSLVSRGVPPSLQTPVSCAAVSGPHRWCLPWGYPGPKPLSDPIETTVTVVQQTVATTPHCSQFRKAKERESNVGYEALGLGASME